MADITNAERQRRYRARKKAHEAGDHSLCDASRCQPVTPSVAAVTAEPEPVVTAAPDADNDQDGIETVVRAYVESLGHPAGDPRAILGEVAIRLARRVDQSGALPAAVRELRVLLAQLAENPNGPSGMVDEVRVRRAQRRLDALLASVA